LHKLIRLKEVLWIFSMLGMVAIIARLWGGLGVSTGLSDAMPWGIWKILNMIAGVALATGGFTVACTVYIFNIKKYKPVLKPAILLAFLGYGASCFALFLDIGLPHTIWHSLIYWNHHSFLFEVAWCVMLYFTVTSIELSPVVLEKFGLERITKLVHRFSIPVVIVGITLSTLHHTSLGSLFLVMPARLHDLWFTSMLPVLFFLSAVGAGMMMLVFACLAYSYFFEKSANMAALTGLSRMSATVLVILLIVKISDLVVRGSFGAVFAGGYESYFFILEVALGILIPVILVAIPAVRNNLGGLAIASGSAVLGLVLNRINVGIVGLMRTSDVFYFPTLTEFCLSIGIFSAAALVFVYMVQYFDVFEREEEENETEAVINLKHHGQAKTWRRRRINERERITLCITLAVPLAAGIFLPGALHGLSPDASPVSAPRALDEARTMLEINGNRNSDFVRFNHALHENKLGDDKSCRQCHHLDLPGDKCSPCWKCHSDMVQGKSIFNHAHHVNKLEENRSCEQCHDMNLPKGKENSKSCRECHEEDMGMKSAEDKVFSPVALSYSDAMHQMCIKCHKKVVIEQKKEGMDECAHCHQQAWKAEFTKEGTTP
jgi:Ni/Fe-hydrogenase subunit HybB-like protein